MFVSIETRFLEREHSVGSARTLLSVRLQRALVVRSFHKTPPCVGWHTVHYLGFTIPKPVLLHSALHCEPVRIQPLLSAVGVSVKGAEEERGETHFEIQRRGHGEGGRGSLLHTNQIHNS